MISRPTAARRLAGLVTLAITGAAASQSNPDHACTWLGGSGAFDEVRAVTTAANGDLIVAGSTNSSDFPVTSGAFDQIRSGSEDAFVARLTPDCATILASTFLGGNDRDHANFVHVAGDGSIWVGGTTRSPDFPTTPDAFAQHGGSGDAFAVRFDAGLTTLLYGTAFGAIGPFSGGATDTGEGFVVDEVNELLYVAGKTDSSWVLPATAIQSNRRGNSDFYVAALDLSPPGGTTLVYATLLGGGAAELVFGDLSLGAGGVVTISGSTVSGDFPTTAGSFMPAPPAPGQSAVIAAIDTSPQAATRLVYSTYFGGSGADAIARHAADPAGLLHLLLIGGSPDLPVTANALIFQPGGSGDAYYAQLDRTQAGVAALRYGSWIVTAGSENAGSIAWAAGRVAVLLATSGFGLPVTAGAFMPSTHGLRTGFVQELDVSSQATPFVRYATHYGTGLQSLSISALLALAYDGQEVVVGAVGRGSFPPLSAGAAQLQPLGGDDGIVGRLALHPWPSPSSSFGSSCAGSGGAPQLDVTAPARLTRSLVLTASGLVPSSVGLYFSGFDRTSHQGAPLPFSLTALGAPGCEVAVAPEAVTFRPANGNGAATLNLALPATPGLLGVVLFAQYASLDSTANPLGMVTTNGVGAEVRW